MNGINLALYSCRVYCIAQYDKHADNIMSIQKNNTFLYDVDEKLIFFGAGAHMNISIALIHAVPDIAAI
jgi:hypothetical protein